MSRLRATPRGDLRNTLKASPGIGRALGLLAESALGGPSPLSTEERLAIALAAGLSEESGADPHKAVLRPLVALARKLARDPRKVGDDDLEAVFDAGWDDTAVVHAAVIVGMAGMIDRLIIGLGLTNEPRAMLVRELAQLASEGYAAAELLAKRD